MKYFVKHAIVIPLSAGSKPAGYRKAWWIFMKSKHRLWLLLVLVSIICAAFIFCIPAVPLLSVPETIWINYPRVPMTVFSSPCIPSAPTLRRIFKHIVAQTPYLPIILPRTCGSFQATSIPLSRPGTRYPPSSFPLTLLSFGTAAGRTILYLIPSYPPFCSLTATATRKFRSGFSWVHLPSLTGCNIVYFGDSILAYVTGSYSVSGCVSGFSGAGAVDCSVGGTPAAGAFPGIVSRFLTD